MADEIDPLEEIAADSGSWRVFGLRLLGAMSAPAVYGFSRSDEVLAEVARLRRQTPESLMNTIRATRYLIEEFPSNHRRLRDNPNVGLSHVNLLSQLKEIDTKDVQDLKVRVLNGEISYRELAAKVRAIREGALADIKRHLSTSERIRGRSRTRSFDGALTEFLTRNLTELVGDTSATIRSGHRLAPVPVDFVVSVKGVPAIAIEAKAPRSNFRQSVLVEMLGVCSLVQRRIPVVWLVTPIKWRSGIETIEAISRELALPGLRFMVFDDQAAASGLDALQEVRVAE